MADVPTQTYVDIGGAQRTSMTGWEWATAGDVHESRPSSASIVQHSGGIPSHSFTATWVDVDYALLQILYPFHLTSQNYELRPDDAAVSGTNPSLAGAGIVQVGNLPMGNGAQLEGSTTVSCNTATLATS